MIGQVIGFKDFKNDVFCWNATFHGCMEGRDYARVYLV